MSDEPRRLLEDPSMPSELRRALDQAARQAPPIDAVAGLERLERAMQGGGAGAGGGGAGGSGGLAGAVGAGIAVLAVVGGVMLWSGEREASEAAPPADVPEASERAAVDEAPMAVQPSVVEPSVVEPSVVEPREVGPSEVEPREAAAGAETARAARPRDDDDALAREMAELAAARAALAGNPSRALSLLERGRRRSGARSLFAEEREALTVLALAGLDRDADARRRGAAFLTAHPTSAFAERVRRAIGEP